MSAEVTKLLAFRLDQEMGCRSVRPRPSHLVVRIFAPRGGGAIARRLADVARRSSSVLVEVAGLPGATNSKTSDLTAMRHFEFRDEFSGIAAQRFVDYRDLRRRVPKREDFWHAAFIT